MCPGCKKNIHVSCGKETEDLHHMLCPNCNKKEDDTDSVKDSDDEEEATIQVHSEAGGKFLRKIIRGKQLRGKEFRKEKEQASAGKRKRKQKKPKKNKKNKKNDEEEDEEEKPKTFKNGEKALWEIRKFQKHSELLVAKRPFCNLVRETTEQVIRENCGRGPLRWQATAVLAIQTSAEDYIVKVFEAAQLNAIHSKRQTIMAKDMHLSRRVKRIFNDNAI